MTTDGSLSLLLTKRIPLTAYSVPAQKARPEAAVAAGDAAPAGGTWRRLTYTEQAQEQSEWCWDASSISIHAYYDPDSTWTQCTFANAKMGRTDCCTRGSSDDCNQPNYPDQALALLDNFVDMVGALSLADVRTQIDAGHPISARIGWQGGGGHNPVIVGYRDDPGGAWLAIADPIYGSSDLLYATFSSSYEGSGTWTTSYRTKSARMRIGALAMPATGVATVVSRDPQALDVFGTDNGGVIQTGALFETGVPTTWHGWWPLKGGRAAPGAPVTCVSRSRDKLDVFVVGTDGGVWTAAWEPDFADWWHGWWRIGSVRAPQGAPVHAVCRSADKLDIFVTDVNGVVQTAAWEPANTDGWHGWWPLKGGRAAPGAHVTAVSRSRDKLDVFVVGTDGGVWTAAWEPTNTDGWHGWWRIGALRAPQGAPVHAVSRSADKLDIFVTDVNGAVQSAAWEPANTDGWHGWWQIRGGRAAPGAPVTAVSRATDLLDIFVVGTDGRLYSAAWSPSNTDGWHGWWVVSQLSAHAAATLSPAARTTDSLDVVFTAGDGTVNAVRWSAHVADAHWRG